LKVNHKYEYKPCVLIAANKRKQKIKPEDKLRFNRTSSMHIISLGSWSCNNEKVDVPIQYFT